jgi:hypothetical protein
MNLSRFLLASAVLAGTVSLALAQPAPAPGGGGGRGRGGAFFQACQADIQANCANAGRGGMRQCLADNQAKLSDACKAALAQLPPPGAGRGQ